jgi:hypothetical protein
MTADGGDTWKKVLYTDDRHGAADLDIDPQNPNILFAGMWYFDRKQWTFRSGDENGGVYRSIDGGHVEEDDHRPAEAHAGPASRWRPFA